MFGFFRMMLALWVMIFHLLWVPVVGPFAVFSFFVLSGFLMTTIMHESYGYDQSGIWRYTINRFLRLYPMYWAVALLSVIAILLASPEFSKLYKSEMYLPSTPSEVLFNITMIFPGLVPHHFEPRLSPPTWALTLEIFFYLAIALGISKTRRRTLTWVGLSIAIFAISYLVGTEASFRYATIFGASLPFSLGALLYFYKAEIFKYLDDRRLSAPWLLLGLYLAHAVLCCLNHYFQPFSFSPLIGDIGPYTNILLTLLVTTSLLYRGQELFSEKFDRLCGEYSYPIYLLHWQCGMLISYWLFKAPVLGLSLDSLIAFSATLVLVFIASYMLIMIIDRNVSRMRKQVKSASSRQNELSSERGLIAT